MRHYRIINYDDIPIGIILTDSSVPTVTYAKELVDRIKIDNKRLDLKLVLRNLDFAFVAKDIFNIGGGINGKQIQKDDIFIFFQNRFSEITFSEEEETDYTDESVFYIVIGNYSELPPPEGGGFLVQRCRLLQDKS